MQGRGPTDPLKQRMACGGKVKPAFDIQQRGLAFGLQQAPQLGRSPGQGHIIGRFDIGLAGCAGRPVRRAKRMMRRIGIDPQNTHPAFGQAIGRGAAHYAQSHHNDIIGFHLGVSGRGTAPAHPRGIHECLVKTDRNSLYAMMHGIELG